MTLEGVLAWGLDDVEDSVDIAPFRDAYLAPFARLAEGADLAAASELALRLGWVCRAVNGAPPGREPTQRTAPAHVPRRPAVSPGIGRGAGSRA